MKMSNIIHREKEAEKCIVCAIYGMTGYTKRGLQHIRCMGQHKEVWQNCVRVTVLLCLWVGVAKVCVTNLAK